MRSLLQGSPGSESLAGVLSRFAVTVSEFQSLKPNNLQDSSYTARTFITKPPSANWRTGTQSTLCMAVQPSVQLRPAVQPISPSAASVVWPHAKDTAVQGPNH